MASFEGLVVDAAIAELQSNSATVVSAVNSAEGGVVGFLTSAIESIKVSNPIVAIILPPIEQGIIAYLVSLEAKEPGSVLVPAAIAYLHGLAPKVGG